MPGSLLNPNLSSAWSQCVNLSLKLKPTMVTASNYHAPLQTEVDTFDTMREVSCFIVFSSAHTNCEILCCTIVLQSGALCISRIVIGVYECLSFNIYKQPYVHRLELVNVHP